MKYSDFPYQRLTVESQKERMDGWLSQFQGAESAQDQISVIEEVDNAIREYSSYQAIASLNFNKNIHDDDAKAEKEYYDSIGPDIREIYNKLDKAVDSSKFKNELRDRWGDTYLKNIEMDLKTFDPKIKDMLRQETDLRNEYTKMIGGAKIDFEGKTYNLAGLAPFHLDKDRNIRKRSYSARFGWFENNALAFDQLYDRLVKLRHKIATTLGYDNFIELGYLRMSRSDYGPAEVANFRQQIVDHVVPIVEKLKEQKKIRFGLQEELKKKNLIKYKKNINNKIIFNLLV